MNCSKIRKFLPLYISDDLDASQLLEVEHHISKCLGCYREYQAYLKSLRALKRLGEKPALAPVLQGFADGVLARLTHEPAGPRAPVPKVVYPFVSRALAAAAVLMVLLTGAYLIYDSVGVAPKPVNPPTHVITSRPVQHPLIYGESTVPLDPFAPSELFERAGYLNPIGPGEMMRYLNDPRGFPQPQPLPVVQPVGLTRDF